MSQSIAQRLQARCPSCNLMPGCCTTRRTSVGSWTTFGCCVQTVFSKDGGPSNTARGQPGSELRGCSRLDEAGSYCLPIPRKPLNRNSARTCDSRQHRHE